MSDWTQPLCDYCYVAFNLGMGREPREPVRVIAEDGQARCLVCRTPTGIYVRIDPQLTVHLRSSADAAPADAPASPPSHE